MSDTVTEFSVVPELRWSEDLASGDPRMDETHADFIELLHRLRLLGMPAAMAANMALDARGIQIARDLCPLLGLGYRAIKRRLEGQVTPSADERATLVPVLGFDPWSACGLA